ncbi:MMS19 nucleotide excision repair protein homolog isoform X2 [Amyelois transitella]|uniref:MMS19 nucleotide excision repair protein homolog isoform X1 n=1 Tax=Amyelois transitella TaxID=680683 RepID=UPI00298F5E4E|nr:MMS19 nucleotide excision repair protein homolog isoform X1 [Amyelois transitella]XP_060801451.1 MMS19 nucleotide excision repair protein homolog isoform X2 [Amyelois transitella]
MESLWCIPQLSDEIITNNDIFDQTKSVAADIMSRRVTLTQIVENLSGVLTHKEPENREKGMRFFTTLLKDLPNDYLTEIEVKFISKFYIDRLKDNHRVIPPVLEGYLIIIDMKNYSMNSTGEFLTILFREVPCQSQLRADRYNYYMIIKKLIERDVDYMKTLGPDFVYGVISAMDGERDPRNLLFLFHFLPEFLVNIPLGHLVEEMFDIISCYYPIDFHPSPDDPAAVSREDLAAALCPCLSAVPEFAEHCLVLLVEKLDSSLRLAKVDSLRLLAQSCKTFKPESYVPFTKTLWSSIQREITHKTDDELKMVAHEALSALVANLATSADTDQAFENFVKGIIISMQTAIAESKTVAQFVQVAKVLLTTANASRASCIMILKSMIPATIAYYGFKTSPKLQIASLDFLSDLYELGKHWDVLSELENEVKEIPVLCLTAVSKTTKEYQMAGFRTLVKVQNVLDSNLVLPFVEVLTHNIQYSQDSDLLAVSVETVHAIARKYPELIMNLVVIGKCDLENLTQDKTGLQKRLNLLTNLASIDEFTKVILEEMLKVITSNDAEADKVVEALSENMSNTSLYTDEKLIKIESDHGLIDSIINWLLKEIQRPHESLSHGFNLIANTISSLSCEKQLKMLAKHSPDLLEKCKTEEVYYHILQSLYISLHQTIYEAKFEEILSMSLDLALNSEKEVIRTKACILVAHFLNKAESGQKFELLYEILKNYLSSCSRNKQELCPRLIVLYSWITKALIMRGHDMFVFWLQKIVSTLSTPEYCHQGSDAVRLIMTDFSECLNTKHHCRVSLLYKQRMFQTFSTLTEKLTVVEDSKEAFLLSWAYVLNGVPKSVLKNQVIKITPVVIDALTYDNKDLLVVMTDVLSYFVQLQLPLVADSLQTVLPRLVNLTRYANSMDVRIKSLQCLYDIANSYRTSLLLPHKQDILIDLAPSLDDKKRLVRNMAVKARTRWFLIGAPGEVKDN